MAAFGITAICSSTSTSDVHTLGYQTTRTSGSALLVSAGPTSTQGVLTVTAAADLVLGPTFGGAIATTATNGFLFVRACNGAPTGVPQYQNTGQVALVYDYANDALYAYNGGWVSVGLT